MTTRKAMLMPINLASSSRADIERALTALRNDTERALREMHDKMLRMQSGQQSINPTTSSDRTTESAGEPLLTARWSE
jgi:hypothetical protein